MWIVYTKKEVRRFLDRIKKSFSNIRTDLKEINYSNNQRDIKIAKLEASLELLLKQQNDNKNKSQVSSLKSQVSHTKKKSETNIETKLARKILHNKKRLVFGQIEVLMHKNTPIKDIEHIIIKKKKLCSRASLFRYISEIRAKHKSQVSSLKKEV